MKQNSSARDVESILNQLNIYYEKEKTFDDLKYKSKLRFDYYLPKYHLCIEFNGAQHYEYVEYFHKDESQFDEQRFKDYIKRKYCKAHDIHLIELPCSLTSDEIRAELIQFINDHSDEEVDLLPEIESFLKLNESHHVYMNQLYAEYKKMLKELNIDDISNYKMFYDYVINYWELKDKSIIKDKKGHYFEEWINNNIEYNNQQTFNENDTLLQFINNILEVEDIKNQEILPVLHLYQIYKEYLKENNSGIKQMSQKKFIMKLRSHLKSLNYILSNERKLPSYFSKRGQYNQNEILQALDIEYLNLKESKTFYFINQDTKNDVVLQHYLTVKEMGITSYSHIPTLVLYEHFKQWLRSVNPGAKPMHQRSYTKKMMQYFKEDGYTKAETKMIKKLDSSQFDLQFFENIAIDDSYRSKILIQPTSDQSNQTQTLIDDIKHMDQTEFKETHLESELKNYIQYLIHNDPGNMLLISSRHDYTVDELKTLDIDHLTEILYDSINDLIE